MQTDGITDNSEKTTINLKDNRDPFVCRLDQNSYILWLLNSSRINMKEISQYKIDITSLELSLYSSDFDNSTYVEMQETIDSAKNKYVKKFRTPVLLKKSVIFFIVVLAIIILWIYSLHFFAKCIAIYSEYFCCL
ncbi:hypothetical protein FACS1894126_2520 [Alphaproteobacteria bacterium]|nr:hypothetical protein FACS1894126_2520 [Alphaproteobacteria bacterium]